MSETQPNKPGQEVAEVEYTPPAIIPSTQAVATPYTPEQSKVLMKKVPDKDLLILPTGEVYLPQVKYRQRLNEAFGPGGWVMKPLGKAVAQGNFIMREYELWVHGRFAAQAPGEAEYIKSNPRNSYATAVESAKSNALMRCCKDLGIASECWDKTFCDAWRKAHAIEVWVKDKKRPQWRRRDAEPFRDETGEVDVDPPLGAEPKRKSVQTLGPNAAELWKHITARADGESMAQDMLEDVTSFQKGEDHIKGKRDIHKVSEKAASVALHRFKENYETEAIVDAEF